MRFFCSSLRGCRTESEIVELEQQRPAGISRNRFCQLMEINRSSLYYEKKGESAENLRLMEIMDRYFFEHPTTGKRGFRDYLRTIGYTVNVKRVKRLMDIMGIEPIYPKKCLSKGGKAKYIKEYLLRNLQIDHRNQVWSTDISYIPMKGGFMYLYAMIDVHSRYVLGWRLSNSLSAINAYDLLRECVEVYGTPEIVNTDQGRQYTTAEWENLLNGYGIRISMDGKGRCKDNIWIERFWRSIKQDYIYRNPTNNVQELRDGIARWIRFYNYERPHQGLDGNIPSRVYEMAA